jgi:hypothetical protein
MAFVPELSELSCDLQLNHYQPIRFIIHYVYRLALCELDGEEHNVGRLTLAVSRRASGEQ